MSLYSNLLTVLTPYANKIKQNEIDIRTAMSLSGGAPIVVASTSAMTDTEQIYVLSTDGNWYYHNGSAWTVGGVYGGVPTDKTLTQPDMAADAKETGDKISGLKADLIKRTEYLENEFGHTGKWITGWRVNSVGRVSQDPKYICTSISRDTMYLLAGSTITINDGYIADYAFWNVPVFSSTPLTERIALKRYVSAGSTITVLRDCYVLLSCSYADGSPLPEDVNPVDFANTAFTVSLYAKEIKDFIPSIADLNVFATKSNTPIDIINNVVWPVNVVNANGYTSGRLNDDETISDITGYYISVFFNIKPNQQYINFTSNTKIHFYDYSKAPISVISPGAGGVFTTPENAVYARLTTNAVVSKWQINEGDTLLDYTKWEPLKIDSSFLTGENPWPTPTPVPSEYFHGPYDIYPARYSEWYTGLQNDYTTEGFARTTKYLSVINAFDDLMALAPEYITKNALGTASGLDAEGNVYTIYEYVFKPKHYNSTYNSAKLPKVYMDGSIHGFEKCSTYGLFYLLKDIVTQWENNQALTAIRYGVELHIIPVSNPYGFDRNLYKNGNDVNINRNFEHPGEWIVVPDGSDQNGLVAFDQPESAIIRDWLLAGKNEVLFYANLHTNGQWNSSGYEEMNANMPDPSVNDEYYKRIYRVFVNHIDEQTLRFSKMYPSIQPAAGRFCGKIQALPVNGGHASAWASTMQHIVSMTLEGFNGLVVGDTQIVELFSPDAFKINSEIIGNMLIQMIQEFGN